jgi:hypothetical protein
MSLTKDKLFEMDSEAMARQEEKEAQDAEANYWDDGEGEDPDLVYDRWRDDQMLVEIEERDAEESAKFEMAIVDFVAEANERWDKGISIVEGLQKFVDRQMLEYELYDGVKQSIMYRDIAKVCEDWLTNEKVTGRSKEILTTIYGAAKLRAYVSEEQKKLV